MQGNQIPPDQKAASLPGQTLRYVAGISWPRSGHHLLVGVLSSYFGAEFRYCIFYDAGDNCCRTYPCQRAGAIHMTKNHDFGLHCEPADVPHLIQCRAFLPSVVSDFELHVLDGNPDTHEEFLRFARIRAGAYVGFGRKWIMQGQKRSGWLTLWYENIIRSPLETFATAVYHLAPGHNVDFERLSECIRGASKLRVEHGRMEMEECHGVRSTRQLSAFRYYDPVQFPELERQAVSAFPTDIRAKASAFT